MTMKNVAIVLAIVFAATNAKPYSKFGRSCKDIGCLSNEVCVMAEQSCDYGQQRDQCGRYPTCQRSTSGGESCTTKICPSGQYCRTENGRPTCVNTNAGLAPAARRPPGYVRPTYKPATSRPAVPTPPPRSSSYDRNRYGFGGNNINTGGRGGSSTGGSGWDRYFGGGSRIGGSSSFGGGSRGGSSMWDRDYRGGSSYTTKRPSYYPGGRDHYNTHTSSDSKGNRVWTFSG